MATREEVVASMRKQAGAELSQDECIEKGYDAAIDDYINGMTNVELLELFERSEQ